MPLGFVPVRLAGISLQSPGICFDIRSLVYKFCTFNAVRRDCAPVNCGAFLTRRSILFKSEGPYLASRVLKRNHGGGG